VVRQLDSKTKASIVRLILSGDGDRAVELLSREFGVRPPKIAMGLPKGRSKSLGCYVARSETIYVRDRRALFDPYVILHEMYHHLRTRGGEHRGTERKAHQFALDFLAAFEAASSADDERST
jgi:hypothetical protein